MVAPNRKLLMQRQDDPAKWEALEVLASDPTNFYRTELDTAGAEKYRNAGGFEIVPPQRYNEELGSVSEAVRKKREPVPQGNTGSEMLAGTVARFNEAMGRPGMGPETVAAMAQDERALKGYREPGFRRPTPEMLAAAESGVADFQQGLRLKGQSGTGAGRPMARPSIAVGRPEVRVAPRLPESLAGMAPRIEYAEPTWEASSASIPPASGRDEEYAAAQERARGNRLGASIGRAGETIAAGISGRKADGAFYDNLESGADDPVRALLAQREADRRKALQDPTSEPSQRLQQAVAKAMPGVYSPEELAQLTAEDERVVTQYGAMRQRLEERKLDLSRQQQQRTDDIAREDFVREDEQAHQRSMVRGRGGGGQSAAQATAAQNRLEADVQKAGEDLEGAGTLAGDLSYLDQMAAKDDIPGVGKWDSKKTGLLSVFASDDDTRTMQTMRSVVGRLLKERSGTAASDAEVERVMTELGMGPSSTEQEFRVGLKRLRQDVGSALRTKQARYRPEVIDTYKQRGGMTAQDVAPAQSGGTRASPGKVLVSNGRETLEIDPADLAEAARDGFREVT